MWKWLKSFFRKHPRKRRIDLNRKKDYEYLLHMLGLPGETGFINLDVADVDTLRGGEAVFLWESAIAASAGEAIAMAKKAAENMAPTPGSVILVSIVQVVADYGCELETIVQIASPIVESFSEDVVIIFGVRFSNEQKGIRFVLATSEGQADTGERENDPPVPVLVKGVSGPSPIISKPECTEEIRISHHAGKSVYGQRQDDFHIENGCLSKYNGCGGNIVLPEGIKEIGPEAFSRCRGLTGIYIPDGVEKIGLGAFYDCINLKRVSLPAETILEIGFAAFRNCAGLTEIQIPWNVAEIDGVFAHCASLKHIVIPDLVTELHANPFVGCTNLNSIYVMPGNNVFSAQGGALFRDDGKELVCCPAASGEYHIPESVVRIGPSAFQECRGLTGIIIPEGVKEIGSAAFCRCTGLTRVTIPSSVEEVGIHAFNGCENLTSLTIRDGVKKIGNCAFAGTRVTGRLRDILPESVMELGVRAFPFSCISGGKRRPGTDHFSWD